MIEYLGDLFYIISSLPTLFGLLAVVLIFNFVISIIRKEKKK